MAAYQAEIKTLQTGSSYTVTAHSGSMATAKQEIQRLYDPIYINNLRQVREGSSSPSYGGEDGMGYVYLIGFVIALYAIVTYWPIVLGIGILWLIYKLCTRFL
jgi:hypothetical protein